MIRRSIRSITLFTSLALILLLAGVAGAQTTVTLPDSSTLTTTLTANVSEQARVTVPSGVTFNVTDLSSSAAASAASVTIDNIVISNATKQLKVSLQADAAEFTAPTGEVDNYEDGDVSYNAASWTNATGAAGTLINTAFTEVATCTANTASCSTTALVFTLASRPTVQRSGNHTLGVTWKFEVIGI